jgi:hypothetical protein
MKPDGENDMTNYEQLAPGPQPFHRIVGALKRLRPILIAVLAIGLATGAAFVALVWLDGSMRFLTPSVIKLGDSAPAGSPLPRLTYAQAGM